MQASSSYGRSRRGAALATSAVALLVVAFLALLLAGCGVQVGLDTKVETDGSGTVGLRLAADKELQDTLSDAVDGLGGRAEGILGILGDLGGITGGIPQSADELFNLIIGQIPGDWTAERGTDSAGARWLTLTRSFSSPEELEEILSGGFLSSFVATDQFSLIQEQGFFSTKTVFTAVADTGSITSRARSAADIAGRILGQVLIIDNRVTLPGSIKEHNADEVEGNTLIWNVGLSDAKDMYAESVVYNWGAIIGVAIAGVIVLAAIIVALVLILRRRRNPPPQQPSVVAPPQTPPSGPGEAATPETASTQPNEAPGAEVSETPETPAPEPGVPEPASVQPAPQTTPPPPVAPAPLVTPVPPATPMPPATPVPPPVDPTNAATAPTAVAAVASAPVAAVEAPVVAPAGAVPLAAPAAAAAAAPAQTAIQAEAAETPSAPASTATAAVAAAPSSTTPATDGQPRPVVPIPLRPTKTPPATDSTPAAAAAASGPPAGIAAAASEVAESTAEAGDRGIGTPGETSEPSTDRTAPQS